MSEALIESQLTQWLNQLGYTTYSGENSKEALIDNIRVKLSKVNKKALNGRQLFPEEINLLLNKIKGRSTDLGNYAYQFNRVLERGIRIKDLSDTGRNSTIDLKLVSDTQSDNFWEVATQLIDKNEHGPLKGCSRYDVTILLNGFPIVQIELKDTKVEIDEAINQINRYIRTKYTDLFKYIQLFVVSNETHTRYGINNNKELNKKKMFKWSDDKNNILDTLNEFTHSFLEPKMLFNILTNYIVRYGSTDGIQDKPMIVMRPYQIYAVKAVLNKIKQPIVTSVNKNNGYVFHTTGSGKTLTSWKCAQLAAKEKDISKVVFLVDRKDLNDQTIKEFKSIDKDSGDCDLNDDITNTRKLLKIFQQRNPKLVVTTIQKFSIAIKNSYTDENYKNAFLPYKNEKILFIIDECHRTQFGDMHARIKRFFTQGRYIGFTGTPIKEENRQGGSLTAELFGDEIHTYHIGNAIKDGNVLGFSVEYYNTFEKNNKINSIDAKEQTDATSVNLDELFLHKDRIHKVVNTIYNIHNRKTRDRTYTALFAVQSIQALLLYYNEFKRHNDELELQGKADAKLKVSAIFTASDNDNSDEQQLEKTNKQALDNIMNDFNEMFGTNCRDADTFRAQIVNKLKAQTEPYIDIVIVVGMLLTGFDSQKTNTLYVDKNLLYHGLLQAFSRTNRIETINKPFGNIVCFRSLKENVDNAIELFSSGSQNLIKIDKDYNICLSMLEKAADEILKIVPSDLNISSGEVTIEKKREFIIAMRNLNQAVAEVKQFPEFDWSKDLESKLPEQSYNKLIGELKTIKTEFKDEVHKESILDYVDFRMELVSEDKIDYEYIQNILNNVDLSSITGLKKGCERIKELVEQSNNDDIRYKRDLIKKFLDHLTDIYESGEIKDATDVSREFRIFVTKEKSKEIRNIEKQTNVPESQIRHLLNQRETIDKIEMDEIREEVLKVNPELKLKDRRKVIGIIKSGIEKIFKKYHRAI